LNILKFPNVPPSISKLINLEYLEMHENDLKDLPIKSLQKLTQLTHLDISYNCFEKEEELLESLKRKNLEIRNN